MIRLSRARTDRVTMLLFAPETRGDFAKQLVLLFPAGLNCPRVDSLKMVAVVYSSMKKNNVGAVFRPA